MVTKLSSVVLGMVDGNLTVLTIADPKKPHKKKYLKNLPSRNSGVDEQKVGEKARGNHVLSTEFETRG